MTARYATKHHLAHASYAGDRKLMSLDDALRDVPGITLGAGPCLIPLFELNRAIQKIATETPK